MGVLADEGAGQAGDGDDSLREGPARSRSTARRSPPIEAITLANQLGGKHGVGICYHLVENRFVGIKSRGVYEAPGMELLGTAYAYLLQLVLDRRARELFDQLSLMLAKQVYQGYGYDLASRVATDAVQLVRAAGDGDDQRFPVQGKHLLRVGDRCAALAVFGSERLDGSDRRIRPRGFGGVLARAVGQRRALAATGQASKKT